MQHSTPWKLNIFLIIPLFLLFFTGCGNDSDAVNTTVSKTTGPRTVKTATVILKDVQPSAQATGTLVPRHHAELHSLVDGKIEKLPVDIGDKVAKGQLLFRIRTVNYHLALQQAEANFARAQVIVKDRKREKERMQNLIEAGSATEQMRDQAITAYEEAQAAFRQAQAARDTARQFLTDCTITAPYDGVVTARFLEEGEYVKKGNKVLEIMDITVLNAELELPERYAGEIAIGLPVTISFSSHLDSITGDVVAVNPKVDMLNRTFLVKVAVNNRDGKLHAGLFCSASFKLPLKKDQMAIPSVALSRDQGRSTVWVVEDGKAYSRKVREGGSLNGWAWILDGLKSGDVVVTEGSGGLIEGNSVIVTQQKS